jgi:hypothetical protein
MYTNAIPSAVFIATASWVKFSVTLLVVFFAVTSVGYASDQRREQEYAAYLQQKLSMGQALWLQASAKSFLAIYTDAEKAGNENVAIILHDLGEHPDQKQLIHRLRTVLPIHNWASLSLQMPLREAGVKIDEYYPLFDEARDRIDAAVEYALKKHGVKHIVIVGYGMGALMAAYKLSDKPNDITAFAAISLPALDSGAPQAQIYSFIKNIQLPFLDIYAEFDLPAVVDSARQRRMAGKDNPVYRQIKMDGEDHGYQQDPDLLVKRVYSWLTATVNQD